MSDDFYFMSFYCGLVLVISVVILATIGQTFFAWGCFGLLTLLMIFVFFMFYQDFKRKRNG